MAGMCRTSAVRIKGGDWWEPRLVLVSSFAVYGYAALPEGATLDETVPVEPDPGRRDAYARAKLAQEALAIRLAQEAGCEVRLIRPGAIWGPGRTASARLGWYKAGRWLVPGGTVPVPAVHVDHVAAALVAAAVRPMAGPEDPPLPQELPLPHGGRLDIVNLVDPEPPDQGQWLDALGARRIRLPRGALLRLARGLDLAGAFWPGLGARLPVGLSEASLAARFRVLRYARCRAEDRLGLSPAPRDLAAALRAAAGGAETAETEA